jgi:hypothetical protein
MGAVFYRAVIRAAIIEFQNHGLCGHVGLWRGTMFVFCGAVRYHCGGCSYQRNPMGQDEGDHAEIPESFVTPVALASPETLALIELITERPRLGRHIPVG